MTSPHQLLWTGFRGLDSAEVDLPFRPGGIILFARNLDPDPGHGPARCRALVDGLQTRFGSDLPLAVALDQEGGPVSRLRPWTGSTPPLRLLWTRGGAAACEAWGRLWGEGLRLLGFNVDFAPVLDLWDGHPDAGIGDRAASALPAEAAAAAGAFLHGLESMGVRGCLKHFPGLGGTTLDSHQGLPALADADQVDRNAAAFVPLAHPDRLVMVAHLRTPASGPLPASLHRASVVDNPWGIQGRFLPDDLEMGGCADWSWDDRTRLSLEAGISGCWSARPRRAGPPALKPPDDSRRPSAPRLWPPRGPCGGTCRRRYPSTRRLGTVGSRGFRRPQGESDGWAHPHRR
ncbi:MAG: glycoside hydrolase family 3 protein [Holophagaceae bacterium]|uniref:beta-N-acetylhexosaminidase n=1 Tax=Candidatus Geothrix odensensis TaxID=2954440 RepID=A0A936F3Y6_9BACT|nr:glycoside hydrolase family 3 protein [Candidatus Geothrix odensensis]